MDECSAAVSLGREWFNHGAALVGGKCERMFIAVHEHGRKRQQVLRGTGPSSGFYGAPSRFFVTAFQRCAMGGVNEEAVLGC